MRPVTLKNAIRAFSKKSQDKHEMTEYLTDANSSQLEKETEKIEQ